MIPLLKKLISIKSLSKEEKKIADYLYDYLKSENLNPKRIKNNVYFEVGKGEKTLLLNTHLDTVPPSENWTTDPYTPIEKNGKIYGLGSCDTKSSAVSMIHAIKELDMSKINGKIIFTATAEEEIFGENGASLLFPKLGKIDAAIIGEPTSGKVCTAQKGIGYIKIEADGKSSHASVPHLGKNAIFSMSQILHKISKIDFEHTELLGKSTVSPTMISGGTKSNIIPNHCEVTLDIRPTCNESMGMIQDKLNEVIGNSGKVTILSERAPKQTSIDEDIVKAGLVAAKENNPNIFFAISNAAFLDCPFVIYGPGESKHARTENESIAIQDIKNFKDNYKNLIANYFNTTAS